MKRDFLKKVSALVMTALTYQLVFPTVCFALTSGPTQPEVQSFEPIGTTDMVDMFTGDFNYNIPLMDVEGYPINIFYHSGIGIEQEASWVGLGWNINPGEINRSIRGIPDDFNGEQIKKTINVKTETETRIGLGASVALETFGKGYGIRLGLDHYLASNNYRGISSGVSVSAGMDFPVGSVGIGLGVGTATGADVDIYGSLKTPSSLSHLPFEGSVGISNGYNSRSGLKDISISASAGVITSRQKGVPPSSVRLGLTATIPIGLQNYTPVSAIKMRQQGYELQFKAGLAAAGTTISGYIQGLRTEVSYEHDASNNGYGYLYLENATEKDMLDFTREKDGVYNATLKNLPASGLTYDVYTVNGHGTGGMFRPHRNDIGTIYDPEMEDSNPLSQVSFVGEVGFPGADYAEAGDDFTTIGVENESGPWAAASLAFSHNTTGSLFERIFYKMGGELTYNQQQEARSVFNKRAQYLDEDVTKIFESGNWSSGTLPSYYAESGDGGRIMWDNRTIDRSSRAINISFRTAQEMMKIPESDLSKNILDYSGGDLPYSPSLTQYQRYNDPNFKGKAHHISQFTQTMPDGRRYVYGIPALNNVTREVTFAVNESAANLSKGTVLVEGNDTKSNTAGRDNFYSSTITPSHAHSYLLTEVLSSDFVDILGDGPTDDDLGTFVKYNYTRKSNDYRWRAPYEASSAQYNPGMWSDNQDAKGNYIVGSREQWYVRSIETKNQIAEFYLSERLDARGIKVAVNRSDESSEYTNTLAEADKKHYSYKLDSIKLFNKHDRFINKENAVPIKTVCFQYSYDLCKGSPNSVASGGGKLTLNQIFIKYGNSQKNLLSPYTFTYKNNGVNYDFAAKDRWGNYKRVAPGGLSNYVFPYTSQPNTLAEAAAINSDLAEWNLTDIKLPSGGTIHVEYESDDYAFVQNKRSMQMLQVTGMGSTKKHIPKSNVYTDLNNINDYIYFKRRKNQEVSGLSFRDNYLEGQDYLYYSFFIDICKSGTLERINGYAKIEDVGVCIDNSDYGYVKLVRDPVKELYLSPITIMGVNTGRYYVPHIFYEGSYSNSLFTNLKSVVAKIPELIRTITGKNPYIGFIKKNKANTFLPAASWIRLQTPGLTKKGGGIRVKRIELSDNWDKLASGSTSTYGKEYDYTIDDQRYGKISSGVASYEPLIGADEIPHHQPIPYSVDAGRGIPSIDFFQEEPFGESFFPPGTVGYSKVTVRSIHQQYARSAQAVDEHLFYTAKDYPVSVSYTEKNTSGEKSESSFKRSYQEAKVRQGYSICLNDMHGKPKAVNNYVVHRSSETDPGKTELITGMRYKYFDELPGMLKSTVPALIRQRGTNNVYKIAPVLLGQDMDLTIDSRYRRAASELTKTQINVNVLNILLAPVPVPSFWVSNKSSTKIFQSLVTTKVTQQYGILQSIESFDHGAKTITENLLFDGESGNVLLSRTNNEFSDFVGTIAHPAYLAYEGMRPAYTNDGYEEIADQLVVNYDRDGFLYTNNLERFTDGDELLVEAKVGREQKVFKLWVLGKGVDNSLPHEPDPSDPLPPDSGSIVFAHHQLFRQCGHPSYSNLPLEVRFFKGFKSSSRTYIESKFLTKKFIGDDPIECGASGTYTTRMPVGDYSYTMLIGTAVVREGDITIEKDICKKRLYDWFCNQVAGIQLRKLGKDDVGGTEKDILYSISNASGIVASGLLTEKAVTEEGYSNSMFHSLDEGTYTLNAYELGSVIPFASRTINVLSSNSTFVEFGDPAASATASKVTVTTAEPGSIFIGGKTEAFRSVATPSSDPLAKTTDDVKRCGLIVAPRYKDKISTAGNVSTWPTTGTTKKVYNSVRVKILRSGRRNNLTQKVQQTEFWSSADEFDDLGSMTLGSLFEVGDNLINTSATTYHDGAQMYEPFSDEMILTDGYKYAKFNPFVLGIRGNYRVQSTFVPTTQRKNRGHSRWDGTFDMPLLNQFWRVVNSHPLPDSKCSGPTDLLVEQSRVGTQFWKRASTVTRYDIYGNALEEKDAIGNFSSAQYGYSKALPMAVATNASYRSFFFDGFEDYDMLSPEQVGALFQSADVYSAFRILVGAPKVGTMFTGFAQKYRLRDLGASSNPVFLSNEASHTGKYSMKSNSSYSLGISVGEVPANKIGGFSFKPDTKYLIQLWAKAATGTISDGSVKLSVGWCSDIDMKKKTGNIDGWYQLEAVVDLSPSCAFGAGSVILKIPSGIYMDDIRALPIGSNMKSFVYDPHSFKLMAQLDENHMATLFEYDQEGLLVRTKKETTNGIVTISENRRANTKK